MDFLVSSTTNFCDHWFTTLALKKWHFFADNWQNLRKLAKIGENSDRNNDPGSQSVSSLKKHTL
jgi:hypothetical protein